MIELWRLRKLLVLVIFGAVIGTCLNPIVNVTSFQIFENVNEIFGINIASKVVESKLHELNKTSYSIHGSTPINNENGEPLFYVFHLKPQGYIVISGSYDLPPVMTYSFTSNFLVFNHTNPLYSMLCSDITYRFDNIQKLPQQMINERHLQWKSYIAGKSTITEEFEQWPPDGTTSTGGWIERLWTQETPYNNFCPLDKTDDKRSIAGCPSIAMAMILDYHKTTNNIMLNDNDDYHHIYGGNNYWIDNDYASYEFPSFPTLNGYLNTLNSHYQNQTPTTDTDIAALIFACGITAKQVYGSDGSGTFNVNQAFAAYQRFNCSTCSLLRETDPNVYGRLAKNMINAMPAHLAVVDDGWTTGHNLVVDGYNTNNFYHLNFGWGGWYDGWYLLPDDIPYGLTVLEGVIIDILDDHVGSQVQCDGSIHLINITPNTTITEHFTIKNSGSSGSFLQWEIISYPDWGTWTFTPMTGTNLTPEQGPITINVSIIAPDKKNKDFSGYIKVINTDNPTDCSIIPVTLATPYKTNSFFSNILQILSDRLSDFFINFLFLKIAR